LGNHAQKRESIMSTRHVAGPRLIHSLGKSRKAPADRETARWPKELSLLRMSIRACGVRMIRLEYDGRDGTGDFFSPRLLDDEFRELKAVLKDEFIDQLNGFFARLLENRHGFWEEGLGACGDFCIDLKLGTLAHVHRQRYIAYSGTRQDGFDEHVIE
jgi:hypothetical protein